LVIGVVLVMPAVVASAVAVIALADQPSTSSAAGTAVAPDWVKARAANWINRAGDANATVQWASTTAGAVLSAEGDSVDGIPAATLAKEQIVIVAHGNFVLKTAYVDAGAPFPTGDTLIVVYDPATQEMQSLGLVNDGAQHFDASALGALSAIAP
jgi:hypothetical protein